MSGRGLLLVLGLLLLAASVIFLSRAWLIAHTAPPAAVVTEAPKPPENLVLIAKVDLPVGTFLKEDMVGWQAWPTDSIDPSYMLQGKVDPKSLVGTVVRLAIATGQPITPSRIVKPGEQGFLAAALKPGMRAISVAVSATTGISGLVFPGDRVDLLLTHELEGTGAVSGQKRRVSETVLENVRILAIDQSLNHQNDKQPPEISKTATIEVNPKQAEMVAVAVELGRLSLSLRSLASLEGGTPLTTDVRDIPEPDRGTTFTLDSDVLRVLTLTPPRPTVIPRNGPVQRSVEVNRGGKVEQSLVN